MQHLRLSDYADRELLAIVASEADDEGWSSTSDIKTKLGVEGKRANTAVGVRLGWMRRYGVLARVTRKGESGWRLTADGEIFLNGRLTVEQRKALNSAKGGQRLLLVRGMGQAYQRHAADPERNMLRREWKRNLDG